MPHFHEYWRYILNFAFFLEKLVFDNFVDLCGRLHKGTVYDSIQSLTKSNELTTPGWAISDKQNGEGKIQRQKPPHRYTTCVQLSSFLEKISDL